MTDGSVGIVDQTDAGAANTKEVDTSELTRSDGTVVERQRVDVGTGSDDGSIIEAKNGSFPVYSDEITLLLRGILLRLDILNGLVSNGYSPPDELY